MDKLLTWDDVITQIRTDGTSTPPRAAVKDKKDALQRVVGFHHTPIAKLQGEPYHEILHYLTGRTAFDANRVHQSAIPMTEVLVRKSSSEEDSWL